MITCYYSPSKLIQYHSAKSLQSCPTLCDPIDSSPPGSPIPGILQARMLEWVAISLSDAWSWKVKVKSLSCVQLLATPWTAAYQAPPSMGFSRQEYWSGLLRWNITYSFLPDSWDTVTVSALEPVRNQTDWCAGDSWVKLRSNLAWIFEYPHLLPRASQVVQW